MKKRTFLLIIIFSVLLALGGCDYIFHYSYSIEGVISVEDTDKTLADVSIHLDGENVDEIVTTDKGGKFQATRLEGEITLTPVKNGWEFSPGSYTVSSSDKELNFMASPAYYQAGGRISYENDQGDLQGVSDVEVFFSGGFESVTTNDSGYWTSGDLRGTVKVSPVKEGYTFDPSETEVSEARDNVDFTATVIEAKDYTVSGRVTTVNGQGLADVEIAFSHGFESVTTNSSGYWTKDGLMGTVKVSPAKEDFTFDPPEVEVSEAKDDVDFNAMVEVYTAGGRVTTENGKGLADVEIAFSGGFESVTTNSSGYWTRDNLRGTVKISPVKEGFTFDPSEEEVTEAQDDIDFTAKPKEDKDYTVGGRVTTENGKGLADVEIAFSGGFESVTTNSSGYWTKDGLFGTVKLSPVKEGFIFDPPEVEVTEAKDDVDFNATSIEGEEYTVNGRVTTDNGKGLADVEIAFSHGFESVTTNSSGYWTKDGLIGTISISPVKEGYTFDPPEEEVKETQDDVDFTAKPIEDKDYTVGGRVTTDNGKGLADVEIAFSGGFESVTTNSSGYWTKDGLIGTVSISPVKEGYTFDPPEDEVSEAKDNVDFTATVEDYSVGGRVTTDDDQGLANVEIAFSGGFESVTTNSSGYWTKDGLIGTVSISPVKEGFIFDPPEVEATEAKDDVDFIATSIEEEKYTVSGRVTTENGQGLADVEIAFSHGFESVTTNSSGYWTKDDLFGTVKVSPVKEGYTFDPPEEEVTEAQDDVDFIATVEDYSVGGRVTTDDGQGLGEVEITFNRGFSSVETGSQGYWHKEGLYGEVKISPALEGYIFDPVEKVVEEEDLDIDFEATAVDIEKKYSISGAVLRDLDDENSGIADVEIKLEGEEIDTSVYTGSDGRWSKTDIVGPVEVTPQQEDWVFEPSMKTIHYDYEDKDDILFIGTPKDIHEIYEVSGFVNNPEGDGVPSVLINFKRDGEVIGTAVTTSDGDWTKERLWGKVEVVPKGTHPGFNDEFEPAKYTVNGPDSNVNFILLP